MGGWGGGWGVRGLGVGGYFIWGYENGVLR